MPYQQFFDKFPKIDYDINRNLYSRYENVTNLFFRIGFVREILNNISSYHVFELENGDTPENVADKIYGDPNAGWMVLYANRIMDPQWEWPLDNDQFRKYIIDKYGSIENAKTTTHHYEMVIKRTNSRTNVTTETRFEVDYRAYGPKQFTVTIWPEEANYTLGEEVFTGVSTSNYDFYGDVSNWWSSNNVVQVSNTIGRIAIGDILVGNTSGLLGTVTEILEYGTTHDYYLNLPEVQEVETFNANGTTITQVTDREAISAYDYENTLNESKRTIKVVKEEYYAKIQAEFNNLVKNTPSYLRRLT